MRLKLLLFMWTRLIAWVEMAYDEMSTFFEKNLVDS